MVRAFQALAAKAAPGDVVYVHYSGHGARAATAFPALKPGGFDEALVPADIGDDQVQYLRDVELHWLLKAIVDRGAHLSVVLDCCHSGSATKNVVAVRGLLEPDAVPRSGPLLTPADELSAAWRADGARSTTALPAWLLEPRGYVLLAACRASESAYECITDTMQRGGAFTHALLAALAEHGADAPCETLRRDVVARVHGRFPSQTPELQGERGRDLFGGRRAEPSPAAFVLAVDRERVRVGLGQVHGVAQGAILAIDVQGAQGASSARAEVTELHDVECWARVIERLPVRIGAAVRLLRRGPAQREYRVDLVEDAATPGALRARLAPYLGAIGEGWVRVASAVEAADFGVRVAADGALEVLDGAGLPLELHAEPILSTAPDAGARVVQRLVHLARFRSVRDLENHDAASPLRGMLEAELLGWQGADYDPDAPVAPRPFQDPGNPRVTVGDWVFLRVRNVLTPTRGNDPEAILNITVLDLKPDWAIQQVFPIGAGEFASLDPRDDLILPFQVWLPDTISGGTDVLKVLATTETTSFRVLELPPIHAGASTKGTSPSPGARWTTTMIEFEVAR
jgi:hypothetical protein